MSAPRQFRRVLCLCPSARLALTTLIVSTWSEVERCVLTAEASAVNLDEFDVVVVMDHYVTRELVARFASRMRVAVLAWNGMFEIARYRQLLSGLDVLYLGTDGSAPPDLSDQYASFIDGECPFIAWREAYAHKRLFEVEGDARYRARWLRARVMPVRAVSVAFAALGALRRPQQLRRTLESGVISERIVWAGNCYLDFTTLVLPVNADAFVLNGIAAVRSISDTTRRLRAAFELVDRWREYAARAIPVEMAHQAFYVTNTLLRWAVLDYFSASSPRTTWFFGRDNLGLGLQMELYVHNLVPNRRIAFLEFGGKTAATALYPRALYLLAREYYVLSIPLPEPETEDVLDRVIDLEQRLSLDADAVFDDLEKRRHWLYGTIGQKSTLQSVQHRVWADFLLR